MNSEIIAVLIGSMLSVIGYIFNSLITKKIDALEEARRKSEQDREDIRELIDSKEKETYKNIFKRVDEIRLAADLKFVDARLYEQAQIFQDRQVDEKLKSLLLTVTTQLENIDNKFKNVEDKLDDLKTTIRGMK